MSAGVTIGIVTVTYNSETVLEEFLEGLREEKQMKGIRVYVVDNASTDLSLQVVQSHAKYLDIEVIANRENLGVAAGNNQGIAAAKRDGAQWILLLNNDTVVPEGTLPGLLELADRENLKILSPVISGIEPPNSIWYAGGSYNPYLGMKTVHAQAGEPMAPLADGVVSTSYASTCCLLIAPEVFESVGMMDETLFVYFDDVDFAIRAKRNGYLYWISRGHAITHKASSLTGGALSPFTIRWGSRNAVYMVRKHGTAVQKLSSLFYLQFKTVTKLLLRMETLKEFTIRQRAFNEGLRLEITQYP